MEKHKPESVLEKKERERRERKERLSAQRGRNGKKKAIHTKKKKRWLAPLFSSLVVLAAVLWFLNGYGFGQRYMTALRVGDQSVKALEYNYYFNSTYDMYNQYMSQTGMPLDLNAQVPFTSEGKKAQTWRELIREQTTQSLQQVKLLTKKAHEAGVELDDKDLAQCEKMIQDLKDQQESPSAFRKFLVSRYGKGFNENDLRKIDQEQRLAKKYQNKVTSEIEIKDEDIQKYRKEHRDEVEQVSYKLARIKVDPAKIEAKLKNGEAQSSGDAASSGSEERSITETMLETSGNPSPLVEESQTGRSADGKEEGRKESSSLSEKESSEVTEKTSSEAVSTEKSKAEETKSENGESSESVAESGAASESSASKEKTEAEKKAEAQMKEAADRIEKGLKAGSDFDNLVMQESESVENAELDSDGKSRLHLHSAKASIYPSELGDWLYEENRKAGEFKRFEKNGTIYLAQFESIGPDERESANLLLRFIPETSIAALEKDKVQSIKEQLVSDFDQQVKDQASFEAFALDGLKINEATEMQGIQNDGRLSETVVNKLLDASVKAGDHKLIEDNGNYYLCFVTSRGPLKVYEAAIKEKLQQDRFQETFKKELEEEAKTQENPLGMFFVRK